MIIPPSIKPGSKIRIISPAGKIKKEYVEPAIEWLRTQGYKVETGTHVFAQHFQFAGTDEQRLNDLQTALDDPECNAIICSRGGYGTVRLVDKLDFTCFRKNPKWLVGFSDITVLHSCLNLQKIATIHGVMPRYFFEGNRNESGSLLSMMHLITGSKVTYKLKNTESNRPGYANAELTGGNLSILASLQGSRYDISTDRKILFIEEIDEYLYHIDRMIHQLKLGGKLKNLAGLIIGDFSNIKDNDSPFGQTIEEIIREAVEDYDYPVCFGFPAGHERTNRALMFGQKWELQVGQQQTTLEIKY